MGNYYRDESNIYTDKNYNQNPITNSKYFEYKRSITGKTSNENQESNENDERENITKINLEIFNPLKPFSNFWRALEMHLINCEIELILTWFEKCVLTDIKAQAAGDANPNTNLPVGARERKDAPTAAAFTIRDTKFYVPVVTLSTKMTKNV